MDKNTKNRFLSLLSSFSLSLCIRKRRTSSKTLKRTHTRVFSVSYPPSISIIEETVDRKWSVDLFINDLNLTSSPASFTEKEIPFFLSIEFKWMEEGRKNRKSIDSLPRFYTQSKLV